MNYVNFFIKSYNTSILKGFMDLKIGSVFPENVDGEGVYIIDDVYNYDCSSIKQPYFLLVDMNNADLKINGYFQDYFIKPLDMNIIKKKLLLYFNLDKISNSNNNHENLFL